MPFAVDLFLFSATAWTFEDFCFKGEDLFIAITERDRLAAVVYSQLTVASMEGDVDVGSSMLVRHANTIIFCCHSVNL